jgi:hypothetical protein
MLYFWHVLLQPLEPSALQQLTATTSATATASAPSEQQAHADLADPAQQQGSGAAGQPSAAAATAAGDNELPAPAAAAAPPAAAAAAAPVHAGGSSRPSSRSSSRRTENLAHPTLGFSSGDECALLRLTCACKILHVQACCRGADELTVPCDSRLHKPPATSTYSL